MSLWQKPESETEQPTRTTTSGPITPTTTPTTTHTTPEKETTTRPSGVANIGRSVQINGELSGNEDLTVDGKIDGKIVLKDHRLTIGTNGRINAEVHAKSVLIQGEVTGNIVADDKVEVASSGSVNGDIAAPRVALADGSSFKGSIDMGRATTSTTRGSQTVTTSDHSMAASSSKG